MTSNPTRGKAEEMVLQQGGMAVPWVGRGQVGNGAEEDLGKDCKDSCCCCSGKGHPCLCIMIRIVAVMAALASE